MAPSWLRKLKVRSLNDAEKRKQARNEELQDVDNPPYISPSRPRDLEYPLRNPAVIGKSLQKTSEQKSSPFMNLPAEIRVEVYRHAIGNQMIHFHCGYWPGNWRGGRLPRNADSTGAVSDNYDEMHMKARLHPHKRQWNVFHSICEFDNQYAPRGPNWHCTSHRWTSHLFHENCFYRVSDNDDFRSLEPFNDVKIGALPLLLTCRKVYTESVYVLYSENTFSIYSYHPRWESQPSFSLRNLSKLLLPMHFNTITALDVRLDVQARENLKDEQIGLWASLPCFDADEYDDCWATMASMPRLRRLYVKLDMYAMPPLTDQVYDAILKPIDRMKGKTPLEFHLAVPEPTFRIFRRHEDPPYTSISFWTVASSVSAMDIGRNGEEWDDGAYERFKDDGLWFPVYDSERLYHC